MAVLLAGGVHELTLERRHSTTPQSHAAPHAYGTIRAIEAGRGTDFLCDSMLYGV